MLSTRLPWLPMRCKLRNGEVSLPVSTPVSSFVVNTSLSAIQVNAGESIDMSLLKEFAISFSSFLSKFVSNPVQPEVPSISSLWHDSVPDNSNSARNISNFVDVANNSATDAVSFPVLSSVVPDSCLKEVLSCELSPLGFHLQGSVKEKIWRGEYIEIMSLFPSTKYSRLERNEKVEDDRQKNVPCSFNNWLQVFCIYASIMSEHCLKLCNGTFQYVEIILEAYKNFPGLSWFFYDELFYQKLSVTVL